MAGTALLRRKNPSDLALLFQQQVPTDFVIRCDQKDFQVHRAVLCARSPIFASMLADKTVQMLDFSDSNPRIVEGAMEFFYKGSLNSDFTAIVSELYSFADRYVVDSLKEELDEQLARSLSAANIIGRLKQAHFFHRLELKMVCLDFIRQNRPLFFNLPLGTISPAELALEVLQAVEIPEVPMQVGEVKKNGRSVSAIILGNKARNLGSDSEDECAPKH